MLRGSNVAFEVTNAWMYGRTSAPGVHRGGRGGRGGSPPSSHGFRFHQTRLRKLAFEDDAFVTTKPPSADHGGTEITEGARRRRMKANFSVKPPCYSVSPWSAEAAFEGSRTLGDEDDGRTSQNNPSLYCLMEPERVQFPPVRERARGTIVLSGLLFQDQYLQMHRTVAGYCGCCQTSRAEEPSCATDYY